MIQVRRCSEYGFDRTLVYSDEVDILAEPLEVTMAEKYTKIFIIPKGHDKDSSESEWLDVPVGGFLEISYVD